MCVLHIVCCVLESAPLFRLGTTPPFSAPQCPDPVTVPLCSSFFFLFAQFSSSAVDFTPSYPIFFVYSKFITTILFSLFSQIHEPQQFHIPWLCSFSKPHLGKKTHPKKTKLIVPPTHKNHTRGANGREKT